MAGTLAFVCAMPMEVRPLARRLRLTATEVDGVTVHRGALGDGDVVAVVTGIGTELARRRTEWLLETATPERVVMVGITGGLDAGTHPVGCVVVPEAVVLGSTGAHYLPAPLLDGPPAGLLWTADEIITDGAALTGLREQGVVCLDMETAAVAQVCEARGVPWSVVRAVSDHAADGGLDDDVLALTGPDGSIDSRAAARFLMRHPGRLPALLRLGRNARTAAERAADAAIAACS